MHANMAAPVTDFRYASCGCNRVPNCVCWGRNGILCYGGCRAVIVAQTEPCLKVIHSVTGHDDRINCVRWIPRQYESEAELVSCSTDKTVGVWRREITELQCVAKLTGHTASVGTVAGLSLPAEDGSWSDLPETFIASASVDSKLRIWRRKSGQEEFSCNQVFDFDTGFILDIAWTLLPGTKVPLLACGGDDHKVHLFAWQQGSFATVLKLPGHEDWLRGLDFMTTDDGAVWLASCAQDCFIRLWKISSREESATQKGTSTALSADEDIKLKDITFNVKQKDDTNLYFAMTLESVSQGHENWVYGLHWQPAQKSNDGSVHQPLCLLSSSMDKTMIIWKPDPETGLWTEHVRVGEVGGNTLGFYGGVWSADGQTILGHGFQGGFHMWQQQDAASPWKPGVTLGGHFDAVHDLMWEPTEGRFLISLSTDQTSRLHGYWQADEKKQVLLGVKLLSDPVWTKFSEDIQLHQGPSGWYELARPQVHGYDMQCIAPLGMYSFASGADEKVVRVFQAPKIFIENLGRICKIDVKAELQGTMAEGASVPALGLSNKAVLPGQNPLQYEDREIPLSQNEQYADAYFAPFQTSEPPTEEDLLQNTLWPEVQKLYGHGYEIFALAGHPARNLLASACKAAKLEHAAIILWDGLSWQQICQLPSHNLTVTQLQFSHDGSFLLSVSRDRTWTVFERRHENSPLTDPLYQRVAFSDKATAVHSRIIWGCAWSHDDRFFVTVARDKKAVIWSSENFPEEGKTSCLANYRAYSVLAEINEPITAVDFAPAHVADKQYLMALGTESGAIYVYRWQEPQEGTEATWTRCRHLNNSVAHHLTVKRLRFCPVLGDPEVKLQNPESAGNHLQLASCGLDHTVKIHSLDLQNL